MSVVWNANIPQPTDLISTSQGQILQNNQSINSVFNDTTNGVFTKYAFQDEGTIASVLDPISVLHAINGNGITFNGHPIPYFKNSVGDFPLIGDVVLTTTATQSNYYFKIGNIQINYGTVNGSSVSTYAITFPNAYTSTSSFVVITVQRGTLTSAADYRVNNTSTTQSVITTLNLGTRSYNYLSVGY
jgi:hypothetical protein